MSKPLKQNPNAVRSRKNYHAWMSKGACGRCGRTPRVSKTRCAKCLVEILISRRALKVRVIQAYGGKCLCCGNSVFEFLTLEHSNKNGSAERKRLHVFGNEFYRWLEVRGYPKDLGLTVLCMNCNFSKGKYGYCPHEREVAGG